MKFTPWKLKLASVWNWRALWLGVGKFFLEACVFVEQERLPVNLSLINGSDDCFKEKKIHCLSKKVSDFFALRWGQVPE